MSKSSAIVCVIDLSAASQESLPLAAKLAREKEAKLVIINPVPSRNWSIYTIMSFKPKKEVAEAVAKAEPFVREIMDRTPEVEWELKVETGDPAILIAEAVEESGADLVVSARHRGRLEVLKSNSEIEPGFLKKSEQNSPFAHASVVIQHHRRAAV